MRNLYRELKEKARGCRDRDIRIKVELICLAIKLGNVGVACKRLGFSRKFYYRWWGRLKKAKYELWGLQEYSRRPGKSPRLISQKYERKIRWYARRGYGSRLIEAYLKREGIAVSRSTICHVLNKRKPPVKHRHSHLKKHRRRYELIVPGQRLQLDVKYVPEFVNGIRIYNYVVVDECTRWRFAYAYDSLCEGATVDFLERLKRTCPFPISCIQTDNGREFTYSLNPFAKHLEHPMDVWCKQNRVVHRLIPPGVKELNGKVERSHRIDEQFFYWRAPTSTLEQFNGSLYRWIMFYNSQRPHGGIEFKTPLEKLMECYEKLKDLKFDSALELIRIKFLQNKPMRLMNGDERTDHYYRKLDSLLKMVS